MELIRESLARHPERRAVTRSGVGVTYRQLAELVERYSRELTRAGATAGTVLSLRLDGSADSVALLLAAIVNDCILLPLDTRSRPAPLSVERRQLHRLVPGGRRLDDLAQAEMAAEIRGPESRAVISTTGHSASHPLYDELRRRKTPGLVLFTSGSSGLPKGAVHDLERLLAKFAVSGKDLRTLLFFYLDHISGFDTLFYALSNGSEMVVPEGRGPESVCRAIEAESVQVLPTSPSFLNMLLLAGSHERFDLGSLVYITYGGEVMHERTLARLAEIFPRVRISQKYGSTEVGALRIAPESSRSLWFRIGDAGTKVRVVDGVLQLRAESTMLGYLQGDDPFTADGWFDTCDEVEQRGDLLRVLGRSSDAINVGGERVHPAKVEGVILELDEVADASVYGEASIILGNVVCARVVPSEPIDRATLRRHVQRHCRVRLTPHEVPVRVIPATQLPLASGFKKERRPVRVT